MKQYLTSLGKIDMIKFIFIDLHSMEKALKKKQITVVFHKKLPFITFDSTNWDREDNEVVKKFPFIISIYIKTCILFYKIFFKSDAKMMRKLGNKKIGSYEIKDFNYFSLLDNFDLIMEIYHGVQIVILNKGRISLQPEMVRHNLDLLGFKYYGSIDSGLNFARHSSKGKLISDFLSDKNIKVSSCIIIDSNTMIGGLEECRLNPNDVYNNTSNESYLRIRNKLSESVK